MQNNQRVADMAVEVLARQAGARARRTGEQFEDALKAIHETEAGRQLRELRDGPHRGERARRWQPNLPRERAKERDRARQEELAWEQFMRAELRELGLRKDGQLAEFLGEALPGESPAALQHLAFEDRRQAEEGMVALMRGGKVSYKLLGELSPEDVPARVAANRLRTTWLKERRDEWLARGEVLD